MLQFTAKYDRNKSDENRTKARKSERKTHFLLHSTRPTTALSICYNAIVVSQDEIWTKKRKSRRWKKGSIKIWEQGQPPEQHREVHFRSVRSNLWNKSPRFFLSPRLPVIHCRGKIYSHLWRAASAAVWKGWRMIQESIEREHSQLCKVPLPLVARHNKAQSIYETKSPFLLSLALPCEI